MNHKRPMAHLARSASGLLLLLATGATLGAAPQDDPGSRAGPRVGAPAPDFELPLAIGAGPALRLSSLRPERAVVLVFGNGTSAPLLESAGGLRALASLYGDELGFLLVCIGASPAPDSQDAPTLEQRRARCAATLAALELPFPAVVDGLDDAASRAYGASPERLFLVAPDGRVAFAGEPGPAGFDLNALELAILQQLTAAAEEPAPARPEPLAGGLVRALDSNGDNSLSPGEIDAASEVLRGFDLDGDGTLTAEELRRSLQPAGHGARPGAERGAADGEVRPAGVRTKSSEQEAAARRGPAAERGAQREGTGPGAAGEAQSERSIESFDYDRDGRLSRIEVPRPLLERWELYDKNDDGYLDAAEQAVLIQQQREQRQR